MGLAILWSIFGSPLAAAITACFGLCVHWGDDEHFSLRAIAITVTSLATLIGCAGLSNLLSSRVISSIDFPIVILGILFSLVGLVLGIKANRPTRWYSAVALAASIWMFLLFFIVPSLFV